MDVRYLTPLYTQSEAAGMLGTAQQTFNNWASGYVTSSGNTTPGLITIERPGRGFTVPFVGLAEAWVVRAFRKAGVPMSRIRPALDRLRTEIGLEHALASDMLKTDGAEILLDLRNSDSAFADDRLVVVRNGQGAFSEVVREHLKQVDYENGFIATLRIPKADGADITLDPRVNFGQPTLTKYGIRRDDVIDRVLAGESIELVARDFDLPVATVSNLVLAAA